jgi:hypothetical protein
MRLCPSFYLPLQNAIIPELNTLATDSNGTLAPHTLAHEERIEMMDNFAQQGRLIAPDLKQAYG